MINPAPCVAQLLVPFGEFCKIRRRSMAALCRSVIKKCICVFDNLITMRFSIRKILHLLAFSSIPLFLPRLLHQPPLNYVTRASRIPPHSLLGIECRCILLRIRVALSFSSYVDSLMYEPHSSCLCENKFRSARFQIIHYLLQIIPRMLSFPVRRRVFLTAQVPVARVPMFLTHRPYFLV